MLFDRNDYLPFTAHFPDRPNFHYQISSSKFISTQPNFFLIFPVGRRKTFDEVVTML